MVNAAQLAEYLKVDNDDQFKVNVDAAVASLENHLGYPLCGGTGFETRSFPYRGQDWESVDPFYDLQSVSIESTSPDDTETADEYLLSQNGQLTADWYNRIRLCGQCLVGRCRYHSGCTTFEVTAKWGFAAPTVVEASEDDPGGTYCTLPADLFRILAELVKETAKGDDRDLQSESRGGRSYSKFDRETVFTRFREELGRYRNRILFS